MMPDRENLKAGERRTATILFSDIKGSTALSEGMDPEELDALMTRVFGLFEEIIKSNGGFVEKYIGDALVAVFGVTELHEDDPARAVRAAREFLAKIGAENSKLSDRNLAIGFRTGINTGLVTTGKRGEFDVVTGHAMNIAQRLEDAAPVNGILISESTKEKCEDDFEFGPRTEVAAKGKTEPVIAYLVKGEAYTLKERGPLIGRREQLDEILKAYIRNRYDEVSGVYLMGDAGIGKTRLAQALVEKIRLFPDFKTPVLEARVQQFRPAAFATVVDVILGYLGLEASGDQQKIAEGIKNIPGVSPESAGRFIALLKNSDPDKADANAIASLYNIFSAILECHASDLFPILIIIDNAPTMDRASREFFQYLFKNGTIIPFFVLTGRDFPADLRKTFQGLKMIKLGPLNADESLELIRFHWTDSVPETEKRILEASGGNPLFIREYAIFARKHRDVSSLPSTVQNIFLASLERYPQEWRELVKMLSVFIHSFSADNARYIEESLGGDSAFVKDALEGFTRDGILVEVQPGFYFFKTDVFKKALYASLLNHNKRILHGLVADIILKQNEPNRVRLIYHLVLAERYGEAAAVVQKDPNASYTYDYLPYIDTLYHQLKNDEKSAVLLLITKAAILFNQGRLEESETVLKRIMHIALARKADSLMAYAYQQICVYNAMCYAFEKTIFTGKKALYYYKRTPKNAKGVQNVLRYMGLAEVQRGNIEEARGLIEQCESVEGGEPADAAVARAEFGLLSGDYSNALNVLDKALAGLGVENESELFFGYDLKLKVLWQLCDFSSVKETAQKILSLGPLSESALSQANAMLGLASLVTGDTGAVKDRFVQAEFYAGQIHNTYEKMDALRTLAVCRYMSSDPRKAEETGLEALTIGLRNSCYGPSFTVLLLLVESSMERGRDERARFFLNEASYFFMTGFLLPPKDLILYYYYASKLLDPEKRDRCLRVAGHLIDEEKARIGESKLVDSFLSIRSFGKIDKETHEVLESAESGEGADDSGELD